MIVRSLNNVDLSCAADIIRKVIYAEEDQRLICEWVKSNPTHSPFSNWFVIEDEKDIAGAVCWKLWDMRDDEIIIKCQWIAVKNGSGRQGIASQLWNESLLALKLMWLRRDIEKIVILVETEESNNVARLFYQKMMNVSQEVMVPNLWQDGEGIVLYTQSLQINE